MLYFKMEINTHSARKQSMVSRWICLKSNAWRIWATAVDKSRRTIYFKYWYWKLFFLFSKQIWKNNWCIWKLRRSQCLLWAKAGPNCNDISESKKCRFPIFVITIKSGTENVISELKRLTKHLNWRLKRQSGEWFLALLTLMHLFSLFFN